ncbi:protein FAM220A [Lynx rufus]|uniref:protein FAM220A n=1 Tax=Lynx rufus TaxID=61384 RepID=UPI001F12730D|nr:protein FAM220A [Lynx rufus]
MRDRVGALGTRPGKLKGAGGDSDKLPCGLEGAQGESPCPSSRTHMPVDDVDGTSQNEELSTEVKNALSEVSLSLHSGNKALPCLKESLRRSSAPAAAQSKTVDLSCAPAGEHCAGVSCWGGGALARGWPGGGPRAGDSHRGWCHKGEPWGPGLPCLQKRSEVGISEEDPPSALLEGRGSESELSCLRLFRSTLLSARPEVLLTDETECVFLGCSKPAFSEQTEYKKMLSRVRSPSADLQTTAGLLALPALEVANPFGHS